MRIRRSQRPVVLKAAAAILGVLLVAVGCGLGHNPDLPSAGDGSSPTVAGGDTDGSLDLGGGDEGAASGGATTTDDCPSALGGMGQGGAAGFGGASTQCFVK